ncbi:DUF7144 family membrane protein [Actinacidiphila acidipaludis]|uniref:DUF7144 domain-containing protein n=1 Tax=Actinacidiphila acidipaludis TaxID=2873382 RepID=A0ABS7QDT3_9ACTN|nr:hypothetical protein [Streptomyces acidipaludis]MBY8880575.1 hypothetical protein [Streptomyces acidipaludis]
MTTADIRRDDLYRSGGAGGWRRGWTVFAGVMMIFGGAMAVLEGITAIARDDILVTSRHYVYTFNLTSWGWIHLTLGVLVALAGAALFTGALWARAVAVALAGLLMVANFLWIPYYPFWALTVIAINAFVIWALCTGGPGHDREPAG